MGKRVNPALIGAFVLGAIGLIVTAVVIFGSGRLFRKSHEFVIYFGGDINGLRVGAQVKFKGVEIGQVKKIRLRLEQDVNRQNGTLKADVRIPVIIELDEEKILAHGGSAVDLSDPHTVPNLIREGLRAQLGSDSFVTGPLDSIKQIASSPELKTAISHSEKTREQLTQTLGSARQTLDTLDTQIKPLSSSLQKTSLSTDAAVKQATVT